MDLPDGAHPDEGDEGGSPIFSACSADFERRLEDLGARTRSLCGAAVGNCSALVGLQGGDVVRWYPIEQEASLVDFGKDRCTELRKVLLEPKGFHALVTNGQGDSWYLSLDGKARPLSKLKGHIVETVSWDPDSTESCTKDLIVGTAGGQILHVVIEGKERAVKALFAFEPASAERRVSPVCGVHRDRVLAPDGAERMVLLAAVGTGLYAFVGPTLDCLFQRYQGAGATSRALVFEVPEASPRGDLQVVPRCVGPPAAKVLFWLTGVGVLAANLESRLDAEGTLLEAPPGLIAFPRSTRPAGRRARPSGSLVGSLLPEPPGPSSVPLSMGLTAYHVVLVFEDRWAAVSRVTHEVVQQQEWDVAALGPLCGLAPDLQQGQLWLRSARALFELRAEREDRSAWWLLARLGQFDDALAACRSPPQRARVLAAHAEALLRGGRPVGAAQKFAEAAAAGVAGVPFEHVVLRFLRADRKEALLEYLQRRLHACRPEDKLRRTLLGAWAVEACLAHLNDLSLCAHSSAGRAALDEGRARLQALLQGCRDLDTHGLVYHLLQSHGWLDDLVIFAEARRDFATVTLHHVSRGEHADAIRKLDDFSATGAGVELVRRFGASLFWAEPKAFVSLMLRPQLSGVGPASALPAVCRPGWPPTHHAQALRYLEHAARHPSEPAEKAPVVLGASFCDEGGAGADAEAHGGWASPGGVLNALVVLYAEQAAARAPPPDRAGAAEAGAEEVLLRFLKEQRDNPYFDAAFALRVCEGYNLARAKTLLYGLMGMHEEAVDSALLRGDVALAKHSACEPASRHMRQRLWLRVARDQAADGDAQKIIDLIHESEELTVRDVLPLVPEAMTIDAFQKDINECLDSYEDQILTLRQEMDEHRTALDAFKEDLKHVEEQWVAIPDDAVCEICGTPAMSERFYAFACGHCFHEACLRDMVLPLLASSGRAARLFELEAARLGHQAAAAGASSARPAASLAEVEDELDAILADDCALCGRLMIETIRRPFVDPAEEAEAGTWAIR